jgi:hypothetical protein
MSDPYIRDKSTNKIHHIELSKERCNIDDIRRTGNLETLSFDQFIAGIEGVNIVGEDFCQYCFGDSS